MKITPTPSPTALSRLPLLAHSADSDDARGPETAHSKVLRNTYALLAMTLLFSASVAMVSLRLQLPGPGLLLSLGLGLGLLFAVHKLQNSAWALLSLFGFGSTRE